MIDVLHDPGTTTGIARAAAAGRDVVDVLRTTGGTRIRIGVASWTDPSMTAPGVFYPDGVRQPEARLRYYASRFPLVEVDSTYYAIPARPMAERWTERTPEGFLFDIKAHALMTGQPSEVARLPGDLRAALPPALGRKTRIYAHELSREILDVLWARFLDALTPLRASGRLGAILLQYPKWFAPTRESAAVIEDARARLGGWSAAVELRNRSWFAGRLHARTLDLLRRNRLSYVCVDSPPGFESSVPPVPEVTNPEVAIIRFHGRNVDTWEAKVAEVSQRFRYLYDETELREWLPMIRAVSEQADEVHLVFNNCYGNYATTNALEMRAMILRETLAS